MPSSNQLIVKQFLFTSLSDFHAFLVKMRLLQGIYRNYRRLYATNASAKLNTLQENIKYFKNIYGKLNKTL